MPEKQCYCYFQRFSFSQIIFALVYAIIPKEIRFTFYTDSCACPSFFCFCLFVLGVGQCFMEERNIMGIKQDGQERLNVMLL